MGLSHLPWWDTKVWAPLLSLEAGPCVGSAAHRRLRKVGAAGDMQPSGVPVPSPSWGAAFLPLGPLGTLLCLPREREGARGG